MELDTRGSDEDDGDQPNGRGDRKMQKPKFAFEMNLGHALTVVSIVCVGFGGWVGVQKELADHESRLIAVEKTQGADRAERMAYQANSTQILMDIRSQLGMLQGQVSVSGAQNHSIEPHR